MPIPSEATVVIEPIALSVNDACRAAGCGRTLLYEMIGRGEIEARKIGKKTLIMHASLKAAIDRLPTLNPTKAAA